jgi:hypothetical protein
MTRDWLWYSNIGVASLLILFAGITFFLWVTRSTELPIVELLPKKTTLPQGSFTMSEEDYNAIGPPFLSLRFSPMTLQLPDLKHYLVYYGKNDRPDSSKERALLHFSFVGSSDISSISPNQHLYLVYDKNKPQVKYHFSPNNTETSLWIDAIPQDKEALVNVSMTNEAGEIIRKPEQNAQFRLKEKEFIRTGLEKWELGKMRVDATLLARQKARWYGRDLFLEKHGGEEYRNFLHKQRIDFGEKEDAYPVYIGTNEALAWLDDKWKEITIGEESRKYPLLVLNKIEDRLIKLDLWDVEGRIKVPINLIKSMDIFPPLNMEKSFKFTGSRTRSQFMFEVNNERILISPKDWFLYINNAWKKLITPQEIDDYVDRKSVGPLFIVDDIIREDGRQLLLGTVFNSSRTEMKPIEIPLQQFGAPMPHGLQHPRKPGNVRSSFSSQEAKDSTDNDDEEEEK